MCPYVFLRRSLSTAQGYDVKLGVYQHYADHCLLHVTEIHCVSGVDSAPVM